MIYQYKVVPKKNEKGRTLQVMAKNGAHAHIIIWSYVLAITEILLSWFVVGLRQASLIPSVRRVGAGVGAFPRAFH